MRRLRLSRRAARDAARAGSGPLRLLPFVVLLPALLAPSIARADFDRDRGVPFERATSRTETRATSDRLAGEEWWLDAIHAPQAWERTTGSPGVRVAIVDSGLNFDQPDLAANVATNPGESGAGRESNGVDDDGNGFVDDWRGWDFVGDDNDPSDNHGHGSMVAGMTAARGDNGLGTSGVAWQAGLVPIRVLGNLKTGSCTEIAAGLAYAVRVGARVVNLSVGTDAPCEAEREVIEAAPGVLFVVAAMNDGRDVDAQPIYPCAYPLANIVCVASTGRSDELSDFSNRGAQSVDLAAPGEDVVLPWVTYDPRQSLLSDGFEAPIAGRWETGGTPNTWGRSLAPRTGGFALSDSPFVSYAANTDSSAQIAGGIDLRGRRDCGASLWIRWALAQGDTATIEVSRDGATWQWMNELSGTTDGVYHPVLVDLARQEGRPHANLRFRLRTDGSAQADGVHVDDVSVFCVPPSTHYTGADEEYGVDSGTSYAAPEVTGVAALILSLDPSLSAAAVKARILGGVDPVPSLAGKTVTGGRLNAERAAQGLGEGAPTPATRATDDAPAAPPVVAPTGAARPAAPAARKLAAACGAPLRAVCLRLVRSLKACRRGARRSACVRRARARALAACRSLRPARRRSACARTVRRLVRARTARAPRSPA
jgi:subtilisin family serine protease